MNLKEYLDENYPDEDLVIFNGFDDAFIGVGSNCDITCVCYSKKKMIEMLMDQECMTYEEAEEYFYHNIHGAYIGKSTPIMIRDDD